jgi:prepilin-type processing-associated H-X9-DG protein
MELMAAVFIVLILAMLFLPRMARCQCKASSINCVNNLKQVGLSFRMWGGDNGDVYPMRCKTKEFDGTGYGNSKQMFIYFQVMSNELNTPKVVICPSDEKRSAATNFVSGFDGSRVSYFVGLDSDETQPQGLLAGDRNLTNGLMSADGVLKITTNRAAGWTKEIHQFSGNIAFADGSVQKLTTKRFQEMLRTNGVPDGRLVFPPQ